MTIMSCHGRQGARLIKVAIKGGVGSAVYGIGRRWKSFRERVWGWWGESKGKGSGGKKCGLSTQFDFMRNSCWRHIRRL